MSELSRKKPNDRVSKFKLKFINTTLDSLNKVLENHTPFDDFKPFDVDDLHSTSDVVVILAQYAAATYKSAENTQLRSGLQVALGRTRETVGPSHGETRPLHASTKIKIVWRGRL